MNVTREIIAWICVEIESFHIGFSQNDCMIITAYMADWQITVDMIAFPWSNIWSTNEIFGSHAGQPEGQSSTYFTGCSDEITRTKLYIWKLLTIAWLDWVYIKTADHCVGKWLLEVSKFAYKFIHLVYIHKQQYGSRGGIDGIWSSIFLL